MRDIGIDHLQEGQDGGRGARCVSAIDEAVGLFIGRAVIKSDVPVFDLNLDADRESAALMAPVVIDEALSFVFAIGNIADLRLHHLASGIE